MYAIRSYYEIPPEMVTTIAGIEEVSRFADTVAAQVNVAITDKQKLFRITSYNVCYTKLLRIIDDQLAFLGGLNVGDEYSGYGESPERWRDCGIHLAGPVVQELQRLRITSYNVCYTKLLRPA